MLVRDANVSYADLGGRIGLSTPAVHERVKRMRRTGVIRQTSALLDPLAIGKPLLAFVHVDIRGWCVSPELLARIYDVPGVVTTRSYIVLSSQLERPVQPETTGDWPPPRRTRKSA